MYVQKTNAFRPIYVCIRLVPMTTLQLLRGFFEDRGHFMWMSQVQHWCIPRIHICTAGPPPCLASRVSIHRCVQCGKKRCSPQFEPFFDVQTLRGAELLGCIFAIHVSALFA